MAAMPQPRRRRVLLQVVAQTQAQPTDDRRGQFGADAAIAGSVQIRRLDGQGEGQNDIGDSLAARLVGAEDLAAEGPQGEGGGPESVGGGAEVDVSEGIANVGVRQNIGQGQVAAVRERAEGVEKGKTVWVVGIR